MNWFGKRSGNGSNGQSGRQPGSEYADIPGMIAERLASEHDPLVLSAILSITQEGKKYRPSEVVDKLAEVLQYPHGEEVVEKAGDALIGKLSNGIHFEDAQLIITNRLARRTEANAKLFVKMLDRLTFKPEMKRLAVEMLASFRGVELRPEVVENIEMALWRRLDDNKEKEEVKSAIIGRFGKAGKGRPEVRAEVPKGEATISLEDIRGGEVKGRAGERMHAENDIPTAAMDIVSGMIVQLRDGNALQKTRAAMALVKLTETYEKVKSRVQLEKIRDGVFPLRAEFPDLYRHVLKAMQGVLPDSPASKPPIAVGPTGIATLGDRNKAPPTGTPIKR